MPKQAKNIPEGVLHFVITPTQEFLACSICGTRTRMWFDEIVFPLQRMAKSARFQNILQSFFVQLFTVLVQLFTVAVAIGFPLSESRYPKMHVFRTYPTFGVQLFTCD
jgi:hypothetical protein